MKRGLIRMILMVTCMVLLWAPPGRCVEFAILGGLTIGSQSQGLRLADSGYAGTQGQDAFGIGCRLQELWRGSFLGVGYVRSGFCDIGKSEDRDPWLGVHSHMISIAFGKDVSIGRGTCGISLGCAHVIDDFFASRRGSSQHLLRERDTGGVLGMRISAPLTGSVTLLWDYRLLVRPPVDRSGRLSTGEYYHLSQGSTHHFILAGIGVRM